VRTRTPTRTRADDDVVGLLDWAIGEFGAGLRVACSLSVEDCLIVHFVAELAQKHGVAPTVFVLDTGRLHEETHQTLERLRELIAQAAFVPRPRRATKPTRGSQQRRVDSKVLRGRLKAGRRRVGDA